MPLSEADGLMLLNDHLLPPQCTESFTWQLEYGGAEVGDSLGCTMNLSGELLRDPEATAPAILKQSRVWPRQ